nr:hypothetical protein [Tanacetum cinerariifolium]
MAIEESKDLTSLILDELIGNLKVHEVIIKKDSEILKGKSKQSRYLALKAKKESSDEESLTSDSKDGEYARIMRDFTMKRSRSKEEETTRTERAKKYFRCTDPNLLIGEIPKPPRTINQRAFVGVSYR